MTAAEPAARSAGSPGGASGTPAPGGPPVFASRLPDVTIPPGTLPGYVLRRAAALGGKPAVIDAATGGTLSYAELAAAAGLFATGLAGRGFGRGSVLAILAPNIPEYPVVFHGAAWAGGAVTTLNPLCTAGEIAGQLRSSRARWLVTVPALADTAKTAAGDRLQIIVVGAAQIPNTECKIVDPATGQPLGPGHDGELLFRGPQIMHGYLDDPASTARAFDSEGFYHSGDIGHIDTQGRLFLVDRIKELIKYKGYQVVPAELEAILLSHPAVADAAVIGLPAGANGEIPKGFVVLATPVPLEDIASYLAERVAPYKRLRALEAIPEVPPVSNRQDPPARP